MQNSKIEWTDHTFNPWHGCIEVSPGCTNCYARVLNHRYGFDNWGPAKTTDRREMSENYWKQPIKWDQLAQVSGRKRVFCASMADVFEDHPQLIEPRMRLFNLIDITPMLDWLLLTKRPENILPMMEGWLEGTAFPSNIWIGTSVEDQRRADDRIPHLLKVPAKVRFLSCEPLLGPVDLRRWIEPRTACGECGKVAPGDNDTCTACGTDEALTLIYGEHQDDDVDRDYYSPDLHWIIGGGESGHDARYCDLQWARSLRDQCEAAGVAFFWKQWGEYVPKSQAPEGCLEPPIGPRSRRSAQALAAVLGEPTPDQVYWRVGKHAAGRLLDGRTWDQFPGEA